MNDKIQIRDERSLGFCMIDNAVLDNDALDIYAQSVYMALCRFASNDKRTCFPSAELIGQKAKCSRRKVFDALNLLEELGYIKREQRIVEGQKKSSVYHIMGARGALLMCTSCTTVVHEVHGGSAQRAHRTRPNELDSMNYIPPIAPQRGEQVETLDAVAPESKDKPLQGIQDFPKAVADLWNEIMSHAPQVKALSKARRRSVNARAKEIPEAKGLEWWRSYFETVRASKLNGRGTGRYEGQVVAFDTAIRPSVVVKVLEGVYSDTPVPESPYVARALEWLRGNYPKPDSVDGSARQALKKIMPIGTTEDEKDRISQRLVEEIERYCRTDEVRNGFIKSCSNWLKSIDWQGGRL